MAEAWLLRAAEEFWSMFAQPPSPPRDLNRLVSYHFPISLVSLPQLSIRQVERWLLQRQAPYQFLCANRELCGCIVAARGHGLLFVDADDSIDEQRFTVAHEVAHFLLDYDAPRRRALTFLGERIRPVLDGERFPTAAERIDAVLASVKLGIYVDMMLRDAQGAIDQESILRAEDRADRLALELLAPAEDVLAQLPTSASLFKRVQAATELLVSVYGIPRQVARTYAVALVQQSHRPSTADWLGL